MMKYFHECKEITKYFVTKASVQQLAYSTGLDSLKLLRKSQNLSPQILYLELNSNINKHGVTILPH